MNRSRLGANTSRLRTDPSSIVKPRCSIVKGSCSFVKPSCSIVKALCSVVKAWGSLRENPSRFGVNHRCRGLGALEGPVRGGRGGIQRLFYEGILEAFTPPLREVARRAGGCRDGRAVEADTPRPSDGPLGGGGNSLLKQSLRAVIAYQTRLLGFTPLARTRAHVGCVLQPVLRGNGSRRSELPLARLTSASRSPPSLPLRAPASGCRRLSPRRRGWRVRLKVGKCKG